MKIYLPYYGLTEPLENSKRLGMVSETQAAEVRRKELTPLLCKVDLERS